MLKLDSSGGMKGLLNIIVILVSTEDQRLMVDEAMLFGCKSFGIH